MMALVMADTEDAGESTAAAQLLRLLRWVTAITLVGTLGMTFFALSSALPLVLLQTTMVYAL
jgi:hypothetical protein